MKMIRFVNQRTFSMRLFFRKNTIRQITLTVLLLCCAFAFGQRPKMDKLMRRIDSLNNLAFDHPVEVIHTCDSLIAIARQEKRAKEQGLLLMVKGVAETSLGNNTQALKDHMQSYHILDSIGFEKGRIYGLCNVAATHLNIGNYKEGQDYLYKALAITTKKDANNLKTIYVNLGVCNEYAGNPKKAIEFYRMAVPYQEKLQDYYGLAVNYHNIAEVYKVMNDYKNAESNSMKAIEYQKKSGSTNALAMIAFSMAGLYTHQGQFEKAGRYFEIGRKAGIELKSPYYRELYYEGMADWSKAKGDYKNCAVYLEKLLQMRDTMNSEEKTKINSAIEAKFQTSLKTKEIELLKTQKKLDDSKIESNRIGRMVFFIISLLCIAIIFILYRNYKLKQRANLLLGRQKSELEEQNLRLENENILVQFETLKNQVSPHFLFNSLNALASLIKTDPDKALEFTGVFSKIFRNALDLKDRHLITLQEELQHVNAYFYLQKMRFGDSLVVNTTIPAEQLNHYLPPFSLQMVVENAIKHNVVTLAQPLNITITVAGGCLVVANDLQQRQHVEDSTGTGVSNIISRYKYLNADQPVFEVRNNEYIVQLPLIKDE
jgi:tetratricopeptide (TPR) repeat protein